MLTAVITAIYLTVTAWRAAPWTMVALVSVVLLIALVMILTRTRGCAEDDRTGFGCDHDDHCRASPQSFVQHWRFRYGLRGDRGPVANAAVFMASDYASAMTGVIANVTYAYIVD